MEYLRKCHFCDSSREKTKNFLLIIIHTKNCIQRFQRCQHCFKSIFVFFPLNVPEFNFSRRFCDNKIRDVIILLFAVNLIHTRYSCYQLEMRLAFLRKSSQRIFKAMKTLKASSVYFL